MGDNIPAREAFRYACEHGFVEIVQMLFDSGYKLQTYEKYSSNLDHHAELVNACVSGSVEVVKLLVERKADVNVKVFSSPQGGWSLLHLAGSAALVEYFVNEHQLNPNETSGTVRIFNMRKSHVSPLHSAVQNKLHPVARKLLELKANPDAVSYTGSSGTQTPLFIACRNRDETMVRILLDNGASPHFMFVKKIDPGTGLVVNVCEKKASLTEFTPNITAMLKKARKKRRRRAWRTFSSSKCLVS